MDFLKLTEEIGWMGFLFFNSTFVLSRLFVFKHTG